MKNRFSKILISLTLIAVILSLLTVAVSAATAPTGYQDADDVVYNKSGNYIYNWGVRGETATFLSKYAESFYTGSYVYDTLSEVSGGTGTGNASSSQLYNRLKTLMKSKHSKETSYGDTRSQYKYTDCEKGGGKISSFYSGAAIGPSWDGGNTWNREHTWPNSKGLGGNDENDIMMLRPTSVSENSSRGNTAYGQSSGYYHPNSESDGKYDLRGDVARICLYVYVRWGNTGSMWGKSGVMESLDVLLLWMEEDPVDTWEMGRNDAVQSITGTRNVFVDYPEYAWLLFGKEIPSDVKTPSGNGSSQCKHVTELVGKKDATCTENGYTGDTVCTVCKVTVKKGSVITASHKYSEYVIITSPSCTEPGEKSRECSVCHNVDKITINPSGHTLGDWIPTKAPVCETQGEARRDCASCDYFEIDNVNPTGHIYEEWITVIAPTCTSAGEKKHDCKYCDHTETVTTDALGHDITSHSAKAPTHDTVGWQAYEDCSRCDYTTYVELPKTVEIDGFIAAVSEIDIEMYPAELYEKIKLANELYKNLREDEKLLVSEEIEALEAAIDSYNTKMADYNAINESAHRLLLSPVSVFFGFVSLLVFLIIGKQSKS
jgi:endonuclease I